MAVAQIQVRRGTTAEWAAADPVVLAAGEQGYDTTLNRFKMGDGTSAWTALEWNTLLPYPVGAIYMSVVSTSPATLFGGTWSALEGRFLIGADGTYTAGSTGGAATHTLDATEMPTHSHAVAARNNTADWTLPYARTVDASGTEVSLSTGNAGSGVAHNNMPPYLSVYMWKRTA